MKKADFVVITPMQLIVNDNPAQTLVQNFVVSKEIETSTTKGRTVYKQTLKVKIHDVTLEALISFVLRAVVIKFQAWIRSKGDTVGEKFMIDNPTYLHDISAALKGGTDTVETLKASADPMAEINKLIAAAGLQGKIQVSSISVTASEQIAANANGKGKK